MDSDEILTAYQCMYTFLDNLYRKTDSEYLAGLLGDMARLEDGISADPAIWQEWLEACRLVASGEVNDQFRLE